MPETPIFSGNGVFLENGAPVIPQNAIAERLRAGNFGPFPNSTAPPGYQVPGSPVNPAMMAAALRSGLLPNIAGNNPQAQPPAAAPVMAPAAPPPNPFQPFGPGGDIGVGYGSIGPGYGYDSGGLAGMSGWGGIGFGGADTGIY